MRCPDCQKFVSLEMQEPEDVELEMQKDDTGVQIHMTCRIVRTCAECGQEMKEATLEVEETILWDDFDKNPALKEQEFTIEEDGVESIEEGGHRYAKSYYGAQVNYSIRDEEGNVVHSGSVADKVPASSMDEMV